VQELQNSPTSRSNWSRLGVIRDYRTVLLITVCCLILFLLGSLEFWWIKQINELEHSNLQIAVRNSIRMFNRNLEKEVGHVITVFRTEPHDKVSNPDRRFYESILTWRKSSLRGPAIKRILFYDASSPVAPRLAEFELSKGRWATIRTEGGNQHLAAQLQSLTSKHRQAISTSSLSTWLYYPDQSALVRPVGRPAKDALHRNGELRLEGYLVLQFDIDYILDRVMPELLRIPFRELATRKQIEVALAVDGEAIRFYRFSRSSSADRDVQIQSFASAANAMAANGDQLELDWVDADGVRRRALLTAGFVPDRVAALGGSQRIALRSYSPYAVSMALNHDRRERISQRSGVQQRGLSHPALRERVFMAANRPFKLETIVKKDDSLREIFTIQYRKNLGLALSILLLLAGAMALAIVSFSRTAKLAKMRLEFATAVSHELRTPVTAIRTIGDNIAEGILGTSANTIRYGKLIREQAVRLSEMIEQTLKIGSSESGADQYDVVPLDTAVVVDYALDRVRPIIDQAGFVLERSTVDDVPPVLADEAALIQSLQNLLSNAVKYGLPGRWVKLEVAATADGEQPEVEISVHDRGPGVSRKEARRIFEPYYRSVHAGHSKIGGFGLGLALAKRMVHGMGGRLTLRSVPGQGSVFTIHLPVAG